MGKYQRNFIRGRMNKSLDERLIPKGEYIDALNVRLGSTEASEIGSLESSKGNTVLTSLIFTDPTTLTELALSSSARTLGVYEDGANETIYWFVHDPAFLLGDTGKCDMIVSFTTTTGQVNYHVISIDDGSGILTTLNFNPEHLITGVNLVSNLLFFTDDFNPPRFININNLYSIPSDAGTVAPIPVWYFTAGSTVQGGIETIGFDQGTLSPCPNPVGAIGTGVAPTVTQIPLPGTDCYTLGTLTRSKGFGIQGLNNSNNFALTSFTYLPSTGAGEFTMINTSGISNPGSGSFSGTITGNNATSGTWEVSYNPGNTYVDSTGTVLTPESLGQITYTGITLVDTVTYTINI